MMILHSFLPFPAEFVAIANGVIFGPVWGTVITWAGAMLGAFLAFFLARQCGQPFVRRVLVEAESAEPGKMGGETRAGDIVHQPIHPDHFL